MLPYEPCQPCAFQTYLLYLFHFYLLYLSQDFYPVKLQAPHRDRREKLIMPDVNGDMYVLFNRYSWYTTHMAWDGYT